MASNSNDTFPSLSDTSSSWDISDADFLQFHRSYPAVRAEVLAEVQPELRTDERTLIKAEERIGERMAEVFQFQGAIANATAHAFPSLSQWVLWLVDGCDQLRNRNMLARVAATLPVPLLTSPSHPFTFRPSPATVAEMEAQFEIAPLNWPAFVPGPFTMPVPDHATEDEDDAADTTSEETDEEDTVSTSSGEVYGPEEDGDVESEDYDSDEEAEQDDIVAEEVEGISQGEGGWVVCDEDCPFSGFIAQENDRAIRTRKRLRSQPNGSFKRLRRDINLG